VAAIFVATLALGGAGLLAGSASAAVVGFAFAGWTGLLLWRTRQPTSLEVDRHQIVVRQGDHVSSHLRPDEVEWVDVDSVRQGGRLQVERRSGTPRLKIVPLGRIPAVQVEATLRAAGWPPSGRERSARRGTA
jgi:hypothetical protein